jgi:predicted peptidase
MKIRYQFSGFFPALLLLVLAAAGVPQRAVAAQSVHGLDAQVSKKAPIQYLLYEPITAPRARLPVILYLHGANLRGNDVNRVRAMGLPRLLESTNSFPFVVVSPLCPQGEIWSDAAAIDAVLDEVLKSPRVDPRRIYVVGQGMGGRGALYMAFKRPDRFAAVIAASAESAVDAWAPRLARLPIWYLHGAQDAMVPVREGDSLVRALHDAGSDVKYTRMEQRDHSMLDVFEDSSTYRWLLQFSKPDRNLL